MEPLNLSRVFTAFTDSGADNIPSSITLHLLYSFTSWASDPRPTSDIAHDDRVISCQPGLHYHVLTVTFKKFEASSVTLHHLHNFLGDFRPWVESFRTESFIIEGKHFISHANGIAGLDSVHGKS